ncbi:hypothetical protein D9M68_902470 [compost metagenome]
MLYWRFSALANDIVATNGDPQPNGQNLADEACYDKAYLAHCTNQAAGRTVQLNTTKRSKQYPPAGSPVQAFALYSIKFKRKRW